MDSAAWSLRSELPNRVRVFHPGLAESIGLRRHCSALLHRTHWLLGHRINVVSSTVVLRFEPHNKSELIRLLDLCFLDPDLDASIEQALSYENTLTAITRSASFRRSVNGAVLCGSVLFLEGISLLPPFGLSVLATWLTAPLWLEFFKQLKERCSGHVPLKSLLPPASVETALSATLISSGLARESLVEKFLTNVTGAIQSTTKNSDGSSVALTDFLHRLGASVALRSADGDSASASCYLADAVVGQRYGLVSRDHVYLPSQLVDGQVLVLTTLNDGSSLPQLFKAGDVLPFGSQVIRGEATCEVLTVFADIPEFQVKDTLLEDFELGKQQKQWVSIYKQVMPPFQLGFGLWALANGMVERAVGVLGFDPSKDCQNSALSSAETAMIDMALNQVHISDVRVLSTLAEISEVFVSTDALKRLGTYRFSEHYYSSGNASAGSLIQILGSVALYLDADPESVFWGVLVDQEYEPLELSDFSILPDDGSSVVYRFLMDNQLIEMEILHCDDDFKIIFASDQKSYGELILTWTPGADFKLVRQQLESLGVSMSILGHDSGSTAETSCRLSAVHSAQADGAKVAYLGDVIEDIPAMSCADVAVGMSSDDVGFISKTVCDLILGGDILWLSRLIVLSRRYVETNQMNSNIIVGSSLFVSIASVISMLSPLQAIALFNMLPVMAEINTVRALNPVSSRI